MDYRKCPFCRSPAQFEMLDRLSNEHHIDCYRCGPFRTTDGIADLLSSEIWSPQQATAISFYIRRNSGLTIGLSGLDTLRALKMPSVPTKAARFMARLAKCHPLPGEIMENPTWRIQRLEGRIKAEDGADSYPENLFASDDPRELAYLGDAGIVNGPELHWLITRFLMQQQLLSEGGVSGSLQITPLGWQEISRLQETNAESTLGFVAMSFHAGFLPLYDLALAPGILAAGYVPTRVDRREHNNRIDDEIIALIKRSRFVVADFSRNRGGIYFEAGLALGLGLPVIWTVREDRGERVHFDTRQFNHIRWTANDLPTFAKALQNRIEATIGRGPARQS